MNKKNKIPSTLQVKLHLSFLMKSYLWSLVPFCIQIIRWKEHWDFSETYKASFPFFLLVLIYIKKLELFNFALNGKKVFQINIKYIFSIHVDENKRENNYLRDSNVRSYLIIIIVRIYWQSFDINHLQYLVTQNKNCICFSRLKVWTFILHYYYI